MAYPAHASPALPPLNSPRPQNTQRTMSTMSDYDLEHNKNTESSSSSSVKPVPEPASAAPPLLSPSLNSEPAKSSSDPATQDAEAHEAEPAAPPALLEELPEVNCEVRARIPTTAGQEMFLHLY
ncbi:hypothetical protein KCU79_g21877, partial [Aureobasidium melanogenum]